MSHIFLERAFAQPISRADFDHMVHTSADCLPIYKVDWHQSLLADDGQCLLCHFEAPDTEAVRMATRLSPALSQTAWPGSHHDASTKVYANVVVERRFDDPADLEALQQQEDEHQWCLDTYQVTFVATFFSNDKKRMLCLYRAPDAESVRNAQRQAGMPVDKVWACQHFAPANYQGHDDTTTQTDIPD
jgi:hypothetical protein